MTIAPIEDRAAIPLQIRDGRVLTEAVEINAAWHCNISCDWCSHASPASPRRFADTAIVQESLEQLALWMQLDHVRILGGEPLLHAQLAELMLAVRQSGIGKKLRVLTNGLILHKAGTEFWDLADEIHISVYPSTAAAVEHHAKFLKMRAAESRTTLIMKYFDRFRVSYREPVPDRQLTQRIYRSCQVANLWRCLTVEHGWLYRCPQAAHVNTSPKYGRFATGHGADGLDISRIGSATEMLNWLQRPSALKSCEVCTGSVGHVKPHRQIRRVEAPQQTGHVDQDYLQVLEQDITAGNSCVSRERVLWDAT